MTRLLFTLALCLSPLSVVAADPPAPVGAKVSDFTLPEVVAAKPWAIADATRSAKATVVVFTATGCPVSNAYLPKLADLHKRYSQEGVAFVAIAAHPADDLAAVTAHAKKYAIPYPVLFDDGGVVAGKFGVERVPTVYVLDSGRVVRYAGRIDDQFTPGVQRASNSTRELSLAITSVLNGNAVATPFAPAAGCLLGRDKPKPTESAVTYHKDVSRILQTKCQDCHRPGEAAPFSLLEYKHAKGWAGMIREVVADNVMPPWHADAPRGHFLNDRRLSDEQKTTLLAWIDAGCPEGDAKDAPAPRTFVTGWRLGREPDQVIKMEKPVNVPASFLWGFGGMPYEYVPAGGPTTEDKWVQAIEVRPDFREAIHHIIAYLVPPGKSFYDIAGPDFGRYMLAAYVPGDDPVIFPTGLARKLEKGSQILFEVHYTPCGKAGKDQSCIGLVFAKEPPKTVASSDAIFNEKFAIPPGASAHEVKSVRKFDASTTLLALTPHMHLRGKSFKYELITPDGSREVLLNVPKYDFNWQVSYHLAKPRVLPAGSRIECTAQFDNSTGNPFNPDPTKKVRWGDQTWEEMMIGFVEIATDR